MMIRSRAIPRSLLGALLAVPFLLGNRGCESPSENDSDQASTVRPENQVIGETPDDEGRHGKACDVCPGTAPAAPNKMCADGSVGGPICTNDASGACAWSIRDCPTPDEDDGKLVTCEDALCGEVPDAPQCDDSSAGIPSCIKNADGTCAWKFSCGGVDVPDAGIDPDAGEGAFCGGFAGIECPEGQYCNFGSTCGAADQGGKCEMKTQACTLNIDPVCGCDEKTYVTACVAAGAGVSVLRNGDCADPVPCDSCKGPAPGAPNYQCKDGVHIGGPACVAKLDEACGWQFLKCPEEQ